MRVLTTRVAADATAWTADEADRVRSFFDEAAADWDDRFGADTARLAPVTDALARGGPFPGGACLDVGAGTAATAPLLGVRFRPVVAVDLSHEMLRRASARVPRLQADAQRLPVPDGSVAVVALVNAFLFPEEVDRVLAPDGAVVWVSAVGADTPIYLSPIEVAGALPGRWEGVWSEAGEGTWCVLRRV